MVGQTKDKEECEKTVKKTFFGFHRMIDYRLDSTQREER